MGEVFVVLKREKTNMKVLHIDDHEMEREGVTYSLTRRGYEVRSVADPVAAFALLPTWEPDVIVLDLVMWSEDGDLSFIQPVGLSTAVSLHNQYPHIPLLIHTSHFQFLHFPDMQRLLNREAGFGYLLKAHATTTFIEALQTVAAGQNYMDEEAEKQHPPNPPVATQYQPSISQTIQAAAANWDELTPSHKDIVTQIGQGYTNLEIAAKRGTTVDTVNKQIAEAIDRLGLTAVNDRRSRHWLALVYWEVHTQKQKNGQAAS